MTEDMLQQHQRDRDQLRQPPLVIPSDLDGALSTLLTLGLIAPLPSPDTNEDTEHYLVHRWTATALTKHTDTEELIEAHRRAAQFWQWRVDVWPQDRTADIQQLVEARYHHHQAHDLDNAIAVTLRICRQLHIWGAWTWEEYIYTETLTWLSPRSAATATLTRKLGTIAQERGDYTQAEQRYQTALALNEELGDRAGIASNYHQLGMITQERGDYAQAEQHYQASLTINEELGDRADIATTTSQLGVLRTEQGRPAEGIPYNISALGVRLELESPEVSTDMFWLARQRQEVGEEDFTEILGNLLDADGVRFVIDAVNTMERRPDATGVDAQFGVGDQDANEGDLG